MRRLAIVTALIALVLVGIYYLIDSFIPKKGGPGGMNKAVEVVVISAKKKSISIYKELPARIRSVKIAQVRPQVSGIILKRHFTEGSFVKKGDPLYQIDPEPYFIEQTQARVELDAARIDLKAKKDNFDRVEKLHKIKAVSKLEFDNAKTDFEKAKAQLAIKEAALNKANIKINYTKVLAPIDGKIGRSFVTQGALVNEMQENSLAVITNLDRFYADITQSSLKIQEIQEALNQNDEILVSLIIPGSNEKVSQGGILKFSESIIDESTGSVSMRAEFENEDHRLLPGLFVKARLNLGKKDLLTIEQSAVIVNPDGSMMVYIVDDANVVQIRPIEIDGQNKEDWIVTKGLKAGDLVVKEGLQKIRPGAKVNPVLTSEEMINTTQKENEEKEGEILRSHSVKQNLELRMKKEKVSDLKKMDNIVENNFNDKIIKSDAKEKQAHDHKSAIEQDKAEMYKDKIDNFVKKKLEEAKKEVLQTKQEG